MQNAKKSTPVQAHHAGQMIDRESRAAENLQNGLRDISQPVNSTASPASLADIAARHERWRVTGDAELGKGEGDTFKPWNALPWRTGPLLSDPESDLYPEIDDAERFLAMQFLRRYVTYRARRGRWASMNGAAGPISQARACVVKPAATLLSWDGRW